jgi:hypothetical protein
LRGESNDKENKEGAMLAALGKKLDRAEQAGGKKLALTLGVGHMNVGVVFFNSQRYKECVVCFGHAAPAFEEAGEFDRATKTRQLHAKALCHQAGGCKDLEQAHDGYNAGIELLKDVAR